MKNNKKLVKAANYLAYIILAVILTSMLINIVNAQNNYAMNYLTGAATTPVPETIPGSGKIVDFYNRYQSTVDFFIMFALFTAIAMIGMSRVGFGEQGNAMKGLAIAIGAALALAALKAGYSPSFFVPFVKNFLFLIIFFVIFLVIRATIGGGENAGVGGIIVSLVLALVVTWVAFNVFNLVLEGNENKFDLNNVFKWMFTETPTDTAEQRRLSNRDLDTLQKEIDALGLEKERLEDLVGEKFTASSIVELRIKEEKNKDPKDEEKIANLKQLLTVMQKIEDLERRRHGEVTKRLAVDKKMPTTPRVYLELSDDKLICTIDPTTGVIHGATDQINQIITYRFEFLFENKVENQQEVKYKDRAEGASLPLNNREGSWKCKVYAYILEEGITPDAVTAGEATIEYLGTTFEADKIAFETNMGIIETERADTNRINTAVSALEALNGKAYYKRNTEIIERFINAGKIKVGVIAKFKEAKEAETGLSAITVPAQKAQKIGEMVTKAKEALSSWENSKDVDMTLYNEIKAFIAKYASTADAVAPKPGEVTAAGEIVKRDLIVTTGTQTIDDADDILGTTQKGSYSVAININPSNQQQTVVQGNQINFAVQIDSQVRNGFNIIVEQDIDGTLKILPNDDRKIEVAARPISETFSYAAQTYFDIDRTLNIKVYDMDASAKDDDTKIVDKSFRIKIQSSGVIDTSRLGLGNIR